MDCPYFSSTSPLEGSLRFFYFFGEVFCMSNLDSVESHRVSAPTDVQPCEGATGAGILLSKEASSRGTVGAETYADRTCVAPSVYGSAKEVVAAESNLQASGKEPLKAFALPANADHKEQERQVQDSISGLEDKLGYKLNYLWFNDDSGKAEVFLLGKADVPGEATPASAPAACIPFDKLVDTSLNLQSNLPLDTNQGDAAKIINERGRQAALAKVGISPDASEAEVKAIEADRAAQLKDLADRQAPEDQRTEQDFNSYNLDRRAIESGLRPGSTEDQVKQTEVANKLAASAIKLGLDPRSSADQVADVQKRIENTPDEALDRELGLPIYTTRGDALDQSMKWLKDGELLAKGYTLDMTPDQRRAESQSRYNAEQPYRDALNSDNLSQEDRDKDTLAISALEIGLPADSSAQTVQDTSALYYHQSLAVTLGLPKDASEQQIKDAQDRSDGDLPKQMCPAQ
jgi:hypothetical protein